MSRDRGLARFPFRPSVRLAFREERARRPSADVVPAIRLLPSPKTPVGEVFQSHRADGRAGRDGTNGERTSSGGLAAGSGTGSRAVGARGGASPSKQAGGSGAEMSLPSESFDLQGL